MYPLGYFPSQPGGTKSMKFNDDVPLYFGTDDDYSMQFETTDGNGERFLLQGPADAVMHLYEMGLHVTKTLDSGLSSDTDYSDAAVWIEAPTSGSDSLRRLGLTSRLGAGYTGSGFTTAMAFDNPVAGTNTDYTLDTALYGYRPSGNRGVGGYARGNTDGHNVGMLALAGGGAYNYGAWGGATVNKANASNIGGFFVADNASAGSYRIGLYAAIYNASSAPVTSAKTAFLADNYDSASNIIIGRHNNTQVFLVDLNGNTDMRQGQRVNVTEVTDSTYAVDKNDYHISVQYTLTGTCTITLPAIDAGQHRFVYHIKDADYNASANNITINPTGSDTIDNAASKIMAGDGDCVTVVCNNTTKNWEIQ